MITNEKLKEIEKNVPTYQFVETEEPTPNIRKPIAKIRETAETFTLYDVMKYLEKMTKAIADKEAELEGMRKLKAKYEEEIRVIEESLGTKDTQEEYMKEFARELTEKANDKNKESN